MHAKIDDNPTSATLPADSCVTSAARSLPSTTSQPNRNAMQMELISAVTRRTVPSVSRNPEKLRNKAKCSNEVGLIMNGVGVSMVIMFLPGVGSLPLAWTRSADALVHVDPNDVFARASVSVNLRLITCV